MEARSEAKAPATARDDALAALLARVALGDQRAFAELYRAAGPHLYAIAVRIVRNGALAEEMLQEAFVSVWHHAGTYDAAKGPPVAWLASIVRNRSLDWLRRREIDAAAPARDDGASWQPPPEGPSAVDLLLAAADAQGLRDCVDALEPGQRQAIALAFFEGLSHRELASRLSQPLSAVKSSVRRALATLRRCLDAPGSSP